MPFRFQVIDTDRNQALINIAGGIVDRILGGNRPRSVFVVDGKVFDFPVDGKKAGSLMAKSPEACIGTFDCEALPADIANELEELNINIPGEQSNAR